MKPSRVLVFASFAVGWATACSDNSSGNTSGGGGGGSAATGGSGGITNSSGGGGSTGGSTGSGGSSGSGGNGGAGTGGGGGATFVDGGTPGTGTVPCGTGLITCTAPDVCCIGGGSTPCLSLGACVSAGGDSYTCMGQANCAAPAVCCLTMGATPSGNAVAVCQSRCSGASPQLCQSTTECPSGFECRSSGGDGVKTCVQPSDGGPRPGDAGPDRAAPEGGGDARPVDASGG